MRQVCNVSFVAQAEGKDARTGELQRWELTLNAPPPGWAHNRAPSSQVTPELDALMGPPPGTGARA